MNRTEHWNQVYQTNPPDDVSWFQTQPATSLKLIEACGPWLGICLWLGLWLGIWTASATIVGWFFQCIIVMLHRRKQQKA